MQRFAFPVLLAIASTAVAGIDDSLTADLATAAPDADPAAVAQAVHAMQCAAQLDAEPASRLVLIDYSLPSTAPRLWVFDLATRTLSREEHVAHGQGSGDNHATRFSNRLGSYQTSLGLFRTGNTYVGRNGYSMRLEGLDPGVNDRAMQRAIVMHGAPYVSEATVRQLGRLGRSWGCPAVRSEIAHSLIDEIKGGQYLYAYHSSALPAPDSAGVRCDSARPAIARRPTAAPQLTSDPAP